MKKTRTPNDRFLSHRSPRYFGVEDSGIAADCSMQRRYRCEGFSKVLALIGVEIKRAPDLKGGPYRRGGSIRPISTRCGEKGSG